MRYFVILQLTCFVTLMGLLESRAHIRAVFNQQCHLSHGSLVPHRGNVLRALKGALRVAPSPAATRLIYICLNM